jgi:hypothetical protein
MTSPAFLTLKLCLIFLSTLLLASFLAHAAFTDQEKAEFVLLYAEEGYDYVEFCRRLRRDRGMRRGYPPRRTLDGWMTEFKARGSVSRKETEKNKFVISNLLWMLWILMSLAPFGHRSSNNKGANIRHNPTTSIRRIAHELNASTMSVQRVLRKDLKLYPYKMEIVQELTNEDRATRVQFAIDMLEVMDEDPDFIGNIMFSDEANFDLIGNVNKQNIRYWAGEPPTDFFKEMPLHSPIVHVCGGRQSWESRTLLLRDQCEQ